MPDERPPSSLRSPVDAIKGVGPRRAAELRAAGFETIEDLLFGLPVRYEDRTRFATVAEVLDDPGASTGPVALRVEARSCRLIRTRRRGFTIVEGRFADPTGEIRVTWFNLPYLSRAFPEGRRVWLYGAPRETARGVTLEHPDWEFVEDGAGGDALHVGRIVPVYRKIGGLGTRRLRGLLREALAGSAGGTDDLVPPDVAARFGFPDRATALREAHFPRPGTSIEALDRGATAAHRRLAFEELMSLSVGLETVRSRRRAPIRPRRELELPDEAELAAILPFRLTDDQRTALSSIVRDLEAPAPMSRLLQGDVGCGKTVVAALAMRAVARAGGQAALMAPTELLAEQHAETLRSWLAGRDAGVAVELLTGSLRAGERRRVHGAVRDGSARIVVGTHALAQEAVVFDRLEFVVIDEQHRFGVAQRAALLEKGGASDVSEAGPASVRGHPDLLVMSATPIPRSLAMTVYGDLDVTTVRHRPPGRRGVRTLVRDEGARARVYAGVRREVERGRQAFVVVPRIRSDDEAGDEDPAADALRTVAEVADELLRGPLSGRRVDVVHGELPADAREKAMAAFRAGETDVLVATTVIEVGVDVPRATVLVVEHAERFGLAQLHQLRGRVGRGDDPGFCVLLAGSAAAGVAARERLRLLEACDDGFEIAERDLALRGPGEVFGSRQHGAGDLRFLGLALADPELVEAAHEAAAGLDPRRRAVAIESLRPSWKSRFRFGRA